MVRIGVALVVALLAGCAAQHPAPTSLPATLSTPQARARTLDRAAALLKAYHWRAAHDLLTPWFGNVNAPDRDRALYLLAQVYYESGDRIRAFYHLDELLDLYPESKLYGAALQMQYQIADSYLSGFKNRFLGMPIVPAEDEAIEMLFRIQERSPGSPLAEQALKRTADYYFNSSQFDLAQDAYTSFLHRYPRSGLVPGVKLRRAFASLARFRGPAFDSTPLIDARAQFKEVQQEYPELAAEANVPQWLSRIDADLARKGYITADFYRRTSRPAGAVYMYRYVIQTYPDSREAQLSRQQLGHMPRWALARPAPPRTSDLESASTEPSVPQNIQRPIGAPEGP